MKTFTLNPTPQTEAFLAEKRKDPVTGETFKEGDEIVFCASCKSAFLKGSWEYMGREHCGQKSTLRNFPSSVQVKKRLKLKNVSRKKIFSLSSPSGLSFFAFIFGGSGFTCYIATLIVISINRGLSDSPVSGETISLLSLLGFTISMAFFYRKFSKRLVFRKGGVSIVGNYIPYQDISECRLSYKKRAGAPEEPEIKGFMNLELFFHDGKTEVHEQEFLAVRETNHQKVRYWLKEFLGLSHQLRLVISPYSFTEEDHEYLEYFAQKNGHTYYTESLYHGNF